MRAFARRYRRDDHGAATTLVAVLLTGGVLLGMGALVVDAGQLMAERQELLSGADAGTMAAARMCAAAPAACAADPGAVAAAASAAAGGSTSSGRADARILCGRVNGTALGPCAAPAANLTKCAGARPAVGNFLEVGVTTRTADGGTVLPPAFGGMLAGGAYTGTTVGACARVAWGVPQQSGKAEPLMISECQWNDLTSNGTALSDPVGPSWNPPAAQERTIQQDDPACPAGTPDFVMNSNGGFLCSSVIKLGQILPGFSLNLLASGIASFLCLSLQPFTWFDGFLTGIQAKAPQPQLVYLVIYNKPTGLCLAQLFPCDFQVKGFAGFVPTGGAQYPWFRHASWRTGRTCPAPCLMGFFTRADTVGPAGTGTGYGLTSFVQNG